MNKIIKKLISLSVATLLLLSCLAFTASAAAKATIAFSNNNPKANDAVTVTVTVSGAEAMYSTEFDVRYNPDVLRFESGDSVNPPVADRIGDIREKASVFTFSEYSRVVPGMVFIILLTPFLCIKSFKL